MPLIPLPPDYMERYRAKFSQQPTTDIDDLGAAISEFEAALPGWWWSVCVCSRTRDASCGPDAAGPDYDLLSLPEFDDGFHCDDEAGTLASSLRHVMRRAMEERTRARSAQGIEARRAETP